MNWSLMFINLGKLFVVCILPLGIISGAFGIYLRNKFKGHYREELIVTGGMFLIALILLSIYVILALTFG